MMPRITAPRIPAAAVAGSRRATATITARMQRTTPTARTAVVLLLGPPRLPKPPSLVDALFRGRLERIVLKFDNGGVVQFGADRIKKGILSVDLPIAAPIIIVDRECGLRKATQELTVLDTLLD